MISAAKSVGKRLEMLTGQVGMSHRYVIDIDKSTYDLGSWSKAAGLGVKWSKESHRPGRTTHETIVPGNVSYSDIALSRAAGAESGRVQGWLVSVTRDRRPLTGAIYMVDFLGMPIIKWQLKEFFPIGWRLSEFDSSGSRPAIETLELAHAGFLEAEARLLP
ncbi:phage tail protein [Kribbella sp. NBC_01505]|uniref:phage tail protein n=1 Tax=Kribbella sp. NBC_01505 TaxID=2903580 RepID=UPI00386F4909